MKIHLIILVDRIIDEDLKHNTSDALHIVKKRGELMHNASEKTKGSMAAVYNLDLNKLNEICEYVTGEK